MQSLLTGLVPGLPPELTEQILARAEGVPLYAVETVRMLLDRGLLVQDGPYYRPVGPIDALDVPETLHGLIAARLDGLRPEERRLVQDASVLGKTFTRAALAALSGLPERDLDPLLASLVAKEVLSVQADPRSPERGQYGFLQDLVRTVAYETLAKRDRKTKHLEVAHYLEQAWGQDEEEIVEVVASHYVEAYRLAPEAEDSRAIRDQARRMLVRAADRAASLAAAEEAESYFRRDAELTDSALERAELVERAGEMAHQMGHPMTRRRASRRRPGCSRTRGRLIRPPGSRRGWPRWSSSGGSSSRGSSACSVRMPCSPRTSRTPIVPWWRRSWAASWRSRVGTRRPCPRWTRPWSWRSTSSFGRPTRTP